MADKSKDLTFGSEVSASVGGTVMLATTASLKAENTWIEPSENGFIGTDKPANTGRMLSKVDVKGNVIIRPSYANANALMALCFDETTGTFTPADDPAAIDIDVVLDRGVDVYTYADCWLNSLTLSANENEPVDWTLDLLGTTEADAGTVADLAIPDRMRMSDMTLTIGSDTYFITGFNWLFSYDLTERFHNSLTRSSVAARIPRITLGLNLDYNADTWGDLFDLAGLDTAVNDVVLAFTDGVNTVTLTHPEMTVMNPSRWPDLSGVDAVSATLELRAWLKTAETDIFSATYA